MGLTPDVLEPVVRAALAEDVGTGDVTTESVVPADARCRATLELEEPGVVCGVPAVRAVFQGPMRFDPGSVAHASGADPASGLRDAYDFAQYNQSTQGHLNADGLCFVKRNYPSPP